MRYGGGIQEKEPSVSLRHSQWFKSYLWEFVFGEEGNSNKMWPNLQNMIYFQNKNVFKHLPVNLNKKWKSVSLTN